MSHRPAAPASTATPAARTALTRRRVLTTSVAAAGALALPGTAAWAVPTSFEAETRTGRRAPGAVTDPSVVICWNQAAMDAIFGRYQAAGNASAPPP
ncbi:twin-arginine translocation signal domain-containing protein [Streptomyces sp. NPDC057193]|uniref:twin-arginine translocation signal domain-containing protein n=1 Tax=Streptomyces sp. NPDC057193 TaxID=3346043 RepID=UPI00362D8626